MPPVIKLSPFCLIKGETLTDTKQRITDKTHVQYSGLDQTRVSMLVSYWCGKKKRYTVMINELVKVEVYTVLKIINPTRGYTEL